MSTRILLLGATGDVGRGIVREAHDRGWSVVATSRSAESTEAINLPGVERISADATTSSGAARLLAATEAVRLDAVLVATNRPAPHAAVLDQEPDQFTDIVSGTLLPHLTAMRSFLPRLAPGAVFLGIGGGMADLVVRGYAAVSAAQAAQRALYRSAARESARSGVVVRELLIRSMVAGDSNRDAAPDGWIFDDQVGRAACDLVVGPHEPGADPVIDLAP